MERTRHGGMETHSSHLISLRRQPEVKSFLVSIVNIVCIFCHSFCGPNLINHFFCELRFLLALACDDVKRTRDILNGLSVFVVLVPFSRQSGWTLAENKQARDKEIGLFGILENSKDYENGCRMMDITCFKDLSKQLETDVEKAFDCYQMNQLEEKLVGINELLGITRSEDDCDQMHRAFKGPWGENTRMEALSEHQNSNPNQRLMEPPEQSLVTAFFTSISNGMEH
ncbi:Olfactory receptor-like protein, partial [Ophiophagus hannah]